MLSFDKIVKRMWKKWWKILFKNDIFELIDPEIKPEYQTKVDKIIYNLRHKWVIIPLKPGVYIVPDREDKLMNKIDLIDKYYIKFLKKTLSAQVWNMYYISGSKALEIHMKNYQIPEKLFVVTRNVNKKIVLWNYEIIFKTISWKNKENKKINLFSIFYHLTTYKTVETVELKIACLELALLEALLITDSDTWVDVWLIHKVIKKYQSVFDIQKFDTIWEYKYIMSFNRLKEITRHTSPALYSLSLDIIKKNGGLFIGEGLRGI